jgi:hypothetical protein
MSNFIRSAIVALALIGTVSAAAAYPSQTQDPYEFDADQFFEELAKNSPA